VLSWDPECMDTSFAANRRCFWESSTLVTSIYYKTLTMSSQNEENKLPAALWAKILDLVDFKDVLYTILVSDASFSTNQQRTI